MDISEKSPQNQAAKRLAFTSGHLRTVLECLICAASGALYSTIFAGVSWYALAWVGLIPLILIITRCSVRKAFWLTWLWGYFWSLFSFMWLREIVFIIPFVFSFLLGVFPAFWGMALPFIYKWIIVPPDIRLKGAEAVQAYRNRNPFKELACCLALASLWCVTEWVRSWILTGLPWNLVGSSQWSVLSMIQICEYTGIYGISFVVLTVNLALAGVIGEIPRMKNKKDLHAPFCTLLFALALVYCCVMFGVKRYVRWEQKSGEFKTFRVGVVQPDLSQRRSGGTERTLEAIDVCVKLSEELLRFQNDPAAKMDLLVWPETAVPVAFNADYFLSERFRNEVARISRAVQVPMLIGTLYLKASETARDGVELYNSAMLVRNAKLEDIYSKVHIVPFGEYVPFGDTFPWLNKMLGMGRNLTRGSGFLPVKPYEDLRLGISICYEDIFAYISRAHALKRANALLVVTNDAWYPTSYEPYQHFANSVFRTVETRLPMLRCGNSNYSVVVGPNGKLQSIAGKTPGKFERVSQILEFRCPLDPEPTFYTRYGNLFIGICAGVFLLIFLWSILNWRTYKATFLEMFDIKRG